jgi:hypothetical protein
LCVSQVHETGAVPQELVNDELRVVAVDF